MSCVAELIVQSNPSLDVRPWFSLPARVPVEDEAGSLMSAGGGGGKRKTRMRGTLMQKRMAVEKKREKEMKELKEQEAGLEWKAELGELASLVTLQSFVRGSMSRGGARFGDEGGVLESRLFGVPPVAGQEVLVEGGDNVLQDLLEREADKGMFMWH